MPIARYNQNLAVNSLRGPSMAIWGNCPRQPFSGGDGNADGSSLIWDEDDFTMAGTATMSSAYAGSIGRWSAYGYAGAQTNDGAAEGGVQKLGSDGDNEGLAIQSGAGAFRMVTTSTLALNRRLWFECRVARSSVTTAKGDFFVGLASPVLSSGLPGTAYPITTTDDTLATTGNLFGFHSTASTGTRGGPTEWANAFVLPSGTVNYPTNLTTLVATSGNTALTDGTMVKLGFTFDPRPKQKRLITSATARQTAGNYGGPLIRFFVNGLELPTFLTADDVANATSAQAFPTGYMSLMLAVMNATGSSPPTLNADWIACAQEGLS